MKNLLQHLFVFSLILFALCFTLPMQAQEEAGPPVVRKEAQDGGNGGVINCLPNSGDGSINYALEFEDIETFPDCDFYAIINKNGTSQYVSITAEDFQFSNGTGLYFYQLNIFFTEEEIALICDEDGDFSFNISFACLEDDEYNHFPSAAEMDPESADYPSCCPIYQTPDPNDKTGVETSGNDMLVSTKTNQSITMDKKLNLGEPTFMSTINTIDYYIYDVQGNLIITLKGESTENKLQEVISRLDINAGIYFVRYLEDQIPTTHKVLKF